MIDAEPVATTQVEELIRAMVKALRAFQMYLPNNPMYRRAEESLHGAMTPVFEVLEELSLLVDETQLVWDGQVVYDQASKGDSFAWGPVQGRDASADPSARGREGNRRFPADGVPGPADGGGCR